MSQIPMPLQTTIDGRVLRLFSINYTTADGEFSTYIYALSFEHAAAIVDELKQTARLSGEVVGCVKPNDYHK